jgi:hypothetical protein
MVNQAAAAVTTSAVAAPAPLRRQGSGPALLSSSPSQSSVSEAGAGVGTVRVTRGTLLVALPADQFGRSVVPISPRSGTVSPRAGDVNSSPGLSHSPSGELGAGAAAATRSPMRSVQTVRAGFIAASDPQLAAAEAEIREWRTLFKNTYGYYPSVRDVNEVRILSVQ